MRVWYFSEMAYHPAWETGLNRGSLRVVLPNSNFDPHVGHGLLNRYLDEFAYVDACGLDIMVNEHHSTATCLTVSVPHAMPHADYLRLAWADPAKGELDFTQMPEAELAAIVRGREAFALYGWRPYMHNPRLQRWLHRIDRPTLLLWGAWHRPNCSPAGW
jgi:hypothetical protein